MKKITDTCPSYDELVESFEVESVVACHDGDWQGDSYYLLRRGNAYGILIFGWGSCSGCDALEASYGSVESLTALRDELWQSITWRLHEAMADYISTKAFELEWYGHQDGGKKFIAELKLRFS